MKYMELLQTAIRNVTEEQIQAHITGSYGPKEMACEHEVIVGTLTGDLRQLWGHRMNMAEMLITLEEKLPNTPEEEFTAAALQFQRLEQQLEAVNNLFWVFMYEEFPELLGKTKCHIRSGLQVTWSACGQRDNTPGSVLMGMIIKRL